MLRATDRNAEFKAGLFIAFSLALLIAMLFVYGKLERSWRGKRVLRVCFEKITSIHPDAVVRYNGLDVGRVRYIRIVDLTSEMLDAIPTISHQQLSYLPLNEAERSALRALPTEAVDVAARQHMVGRNMVEVKMEVLAEQDAKRYRLDDRVKITITPMGEAWVDIISGSGPPLPPDDSVVLIGMAGDMYTDLSKSLDQVKNILRSASKMIGGGGDESPLEQQVENFNTFTTRFDGVMTALEKNLPESWDSIDRSLVNTQSQLRSSAEGIANIAPPLLSAMDQVIALTGDMKARIKLMTDAGEKQVRDFKDIASIEMAELGDTVKDYRNRIPLLVTGMKDFSLNIKQDIDALERYMARLDVSIGQSIASTQEMFKELRTGADALEEKTWYMAKYPWSLTEKLTREQGLGMDVAWRRDLMRRHFWELREDLGASVKAISPDGTVEQSRLDRIKKLIEEMDLFLQEPLNSDEAAPTRSRTSRGRR